MFSLLGQTSRVQNPCFILQLFGRLLKFYAGKRKGGIKPKHLPWSLSIFNQVYQETPQANSCLEGGEVAPLPGLGMSLQTFSKLLTLCLASGSWEWSDRARHLCASSKVWMSPEHVGLGHVGGVPASCSTVLGCECFGKGLVLWEEEREAVPRGCDCHRPCYSVIF